MVTLPGCIVEVFITVSAREGMFWCACVLELQKDLPGERMCVSALVKPLFKLLLNVNKCLDL